MNTQSTFVELNFNLLQKVINLLFIMRISLDQGRKFFSDQSKVSSLETQIILLTLHFSDD